MLVQDVMRRDVVTVAPDTTLPAAIHRMGERGIRHLPVVEGDRLVGIVSDRDLKRAMGSGSGLERDERADWLDRLCVAEFMTRAVLTIGPGFPVEDAARVMVRERISALPVTEAGRLVGIVTETDVLALFVRALGALEPSSRLDIPLGDRREALAEVVETVEGAATPISSVMTLVDPAGHREVVIRVATINPGPAIHALEARGYKPRDSWRGGRQA